MNDPKNPSKEEEEELEPISATEELSLHDEKADEEGEKKEETEPLYPTDEHLRPPTQQYNL